MPFDAKSFGEEFSKRMRESIAKKMKEHFTAAISPFMAEINQHGGKVTFYGDAIENGGVNIEGVPDELIERIRKAIAEKK